MTEPLDTSDIDRYIGVPLHRSGTIEPIVTNDIRRWVQAMHHPNRLHFDDEYAAESRFGRIVAPQSFTIVTEGSHGARPALPGNIPDTHMLFGGDEWWFFGPRIFPGDQIVVDQMVFDHRSTETRFAGPTVIQRGDNHYTNTRGEKIALQRSSSVRFRPAAARETGAVTDDPKELTESDLARILKERREYVSTISDLGHGRRSWDEVNIGDELPAKVIGPHSVVSFATEWRAYLMNVWHAMWYEDLKPIEDSGWTPEMSYSAENAAWDPEFGDGAYFGMSRGHLFPQYAQHLGVPRAYGYGASMGAWILDYLSSWAGEWGFVEHSNAQYRGLAFAGDVTYVRGTVTDKTHPTLRRSFADPAVRGVLPVDPSQGRVHIDYVMTDQNGGLVAKGKGEVLLPRD